MSTRYEYSFNIEIFYEPEQFRAVNEMLGAFGLSGKVGLSGEFSVATLSITSKEDRDPMTPKHLEECRKIFQDGMTDMTKEEKFKGITLTVKPGRLTNETKEIEA